MADEKKDVLGLGAVRAIAEALEQLDDEARQRVLTSALALVGMKMPVAGPEAHGASGSGANQGGSGSDAGNLGAVSAHESKPKQTDIKTLKEQKRPTTDIEMITLLAYYLEYEAPQGERKDTVTAEDIKKYFVQAHYRLPKDAGQTLINAKNSGYLDSSARGQFKLNPVGYNLVAHNLPHSDSAGTSAKRASTKPSTGKKAKRNMAKKVGR